MKAITTGSKVKLNLGGVVRVYEVTLIVNNEYKIFNKFTTSMWVSLDFINSNLVD